MIAVRTRKGAGHPLAALAEKSQRDPEQDRHEQYLQDLARDEGTEEGVGDDVQEEAGHTLLVRLADIGRYRPPIERGGIDMESRARPDHIGDDQPDRQRQRRECEEIGHRLCPDPPERLQVRHAGDAGRDRQEDDRRNDRLHQLDERVAQRLQRRSEGGKHPADQHP
jgi:hypothetical protein